MARRKGGFEGSVREDPKGSGSWQGRLPIRLDPHRRAVPGRYDSEIECRRALNETIADIDRGRKVKSIGKPGDPVRRLRDFVTEYIEDRRNDGMDPIALNTGRDYRDVLKHVITHPYANLGKVPVNRIDGPTLDIWLRQMRDAGVAHRRATKAFAIVRATLAWEVRKGRSQRQTADPVLLPSWGELAKLASNPPLLDDRLLILTIAWGGLRWSEAVSLAVSDVWPSRPRLSVRRIFAWDAASATWEVEEVKGGLAETIPLLTPLWAALLELAATREVEDRLGGDLLFKPTRFGRGMKPTMTIDHSDWSKRVWYPARKAAGLVGDPTAPDLDPRRRALHIKDLRAYAASVVVDSGGTQYEAAALLRHADVRTTNKYYARAQDERSQDPARAKLRLDLQLTLPERIDALWLAWCGAYPERTLSLLLLP